VFHEDKGTVYFMFRHIATSAGLFGTILTAMSGQVAFAQVTPAENTSGVTKWQSRAKWHQLLKKNVGGTLLLGDDAVEFRSPKFSHKWPYGEIKTFDLMNTPSPEGNKGRRSNAAQNLIIAGYENRHWHEPGERRFRFTLEQAMPPDIAAEFTARVGRPVINGDPSPDQPVIAEIPAHHRQRFGGSNGALRLRRDGIDYVTSDGHDGRSWRWSDIQTIDNPEPYEFRVMAYREIVEFDLKQPLSRDLFDKLWDSLYAVDLNVAPPQEVHHQ
jgi:hypothetical protein